MPVGIVVDCISILLGSLIGSRLRRIPQKLNEMLPVLFGFCAIAIGINSSIKATNMTAVVLAVLVGYVLGQLLHIEEVLQGGLGKLIARLHLGGEEFDHEAYITVVALFCFSGFGWYATLVESISGNPGILYSKAVLDCFTAMLFAAVLGKAVMLIPAGTFVVMLLVFGVGKVVSPMMSDSLFANFCSCGGLLTIATGFRVAKIKSVPIINMMPALILVVPFTMLLKI